MDIIAYDLPGTLYRHGLAYIFLSYTYNFRVKLFTRIKEGNINLPTMSNLFPSSI